MHSGGYVPMCIHGLIGVVMVAVESGYLPNHSASAALKVETPAGITEVCYRRKPESGLEVTVRNVPCFVLEHDFEVDLASRSVRADIVFGGGIFAIVEAADLGLRVSPECELELQQAGLAIRSAINRKKQFFHPERPQIAGVDLVQICDTPSEPRAQARNVVVFGRGQLDRSPCGTGTCAKMALLHSRGRLPLGQEFVHESILGTLFTGKLIAEKCVGSYRGVMPEVTGTAFITRIQQFVADPRDPLREGFLLGADSDQTPS